MSPISQIENRKAKFKYTVLETLEVGLQLTGTEVKSVRAGKVSISEAYVTLHNNELHLTNANIAVYSHGNVYNHIPDRSRKCLASRSEITWLKSKVEQKGLTLIPLKLYFKGRWLKCLVGVCQGKKAHDKRQTIKERELKRETDRALKHVKYSTKT